MDYFFINRNKEMRKNKQLSSTKSLLAIKQRQSSHFDPDQLANRNISGQGIPALGDSRNFYIGRMLIVLKNESISSNYWAPAKYIEKEEKTMF